MNTPSSSNTPIKAQATGLLGLLPATSSALPLLFLIPVLLQPRSRQPRPRPAQASESAAANQPEANDPVTAAGHSDDQQQVPIHSDANYGPGRIQKSSRQRSFRGPSAFPLSNPAPDGGLASRPKQTQEQSADTAENPPASETQAEVIPTRPVQKRSMIPPMDLLGFLSDASPYIPGINQRPIAHMIRARDIAGQIRSMRENPVPSTLAASTSSRNPAETPLGIISALRRNMQGNVPPVLTKAEQTMNLVKTLRGGGAGNLMQTMNGIMGGGSPMEAVSNIVHSEPAPVSPVNSEMEGKIGNALNKALMNMDEGKRQQFVKMAQDVINKMK